MSASSGLLRNVVKVSGLTAEHSILEVKSFLLGSKEQSHDPRKLEDLKT